MTETVKASVPLNIRWTQEFVDDGAGGDKFYIRLTPRIQTSGRYSAGTSNIKVANLLTIIQKLKREKSNEIQKAAKYGMQQGIKSADWNAQRRQKETAESNRIAAAAEETRRQNEMFGPSISSSRFQEKMWEEAQRRGDTLNVAKEEKEEDEKSEKEEVYYIK